MILQQEPNQYSHETATPARKGVAPVHRNRDRRAKLSFLTGDTSWTPLTTGPYLVPVTRWIE